MTTKAKALALNGMHTAGIFSDMSVDGPEIGTLVLVVDRAKNLPNRKTIGKQDPYCAARLGKEAKKTTTDIRGGQTPKWDQELRFTVHDSPDYYQLKVSVFNDDKKTELIGETWIDLRDIVVPGGGQSDHWHQLACRGKYAGEVRIEITYYDSRPKPEKPAVKAKPPVAAEPEAAPTAAGPRPVPKRRPLPSDPVTGKAPAQPAPAPEQVEAPRPKQNPQQTEYALVAPASTQQYYQQPDPAREFGTPARPDAHAQQYRTPDRHEPYDQSYSPQYQQPGYDRRESFDPHQASESRALEDDRPPPPPAHRSRTGSNPSMNGAFHATPPTMRQDVLRSEAHRNSVSGSYPGRPTYKAYDSAPAGLTGSQYSNPDQGPPARHYSYDPAYEQHRTMQATVEDVPESPESINNPLRSSGRWAHPPSQVQPQYEPDYDMTASPAPLALTGRGSSDLVRSPHAADQTRYQTNGYQMTPSDFPQRESPEYMSNPGRHSEPSLGTHAAPEDQMALTYRGQSEEPYSVPDVPASLIPGVDPNIAKEIADRINQDRRQSTQARDYTQQALVETPPRGRTMGYSRDGSPATYNAPNPHSRSPVVYTNGPSTSSVNVVIKSRAYSPNPPRDPSPNPHHQHTIRRKSVSPRPPVETNRRLSGIPFGPDSYDALNPSASSAALQDPATTRPDYDEASGKIITHDGREVDPSDHLPVESWAPEPEPKQPSSTSASARPSGPSGPQPAPASGRRPLRVAGRPQSMLPSSSSSVVTFSGGPDHVENVAPSAAAGRNRLQKKAAYRQSTTGLSGTGGVPMMSGANGPGPGNNLGNGGGGSMNEFRRSGSGITGVGGGGTEDFTPPRQMSRAATFDSYAGGENYAPSSYGNGHGHGHSYSGGGSGGGGYGTSPGNGHGGAGGVNGLHHYRSRSGDANMHGAPPIPAKVPLALPPPSGHSPGGSGGGSDGVMGMSGALQLHSSSPAARRGQSHHAHAGYDGFGHGGDGYGGGGGGGGNGGGVLSLEEELRRIDIGTGRSSRKYNAAAGGAGHGYGGHGQGFVYGQQGGY